MRVVAINTHAEDMGGTPGSARRGDYRFLWSLVRSYRRALRLVLVLMLAQSVVTLINPWLAGQFSLALLAHQPVSDLLLLWFAVIVTQSVLSYVVNLRLQNTTAELIADASSRVFDHLQSLPLSWHQDRRRGDVLALVNQDVNRLGYFVTYTLTPVLPLLLTCAGALLMMLRIQPWIGLGAALLIGMVAIAMRLVGRKLRPLGHQAIQAYATKSAIAEQGLVMLPIVKAYAGESAESGRFGAQAQVLRDIEIREARLQLKVAPLVQILAAGAVLVLLWVASHDVAHGDMSAGDLVSLLLYGLMLAQPMSALAGVYGGVQSARGTAQRLIALFGESPEPDDGNLEVDTLRGEVVFEAVDFHYPGREQVLSDVDLHIRARETVALTGANGAGKSTLVHLLMRFADPDSGRILVDGHDLRDFRLRGLRDHIGLVSQNVLLFNASVRENIAYGRGSASHAEIESAARSARAHDFVMALPNGYDTIVGDQGIRLSGGQKQRIALARALLKDPALLILDEATAMFDPAGEREFISECKDLLRDRTVLLITHRPASLALADRVLRLDHGRITEVPTP